MLTAQPCDIGFVFAHSSEQGCTEDLLGELQYFEADGLPIRLGTLHGRRIAIATSGPGRAAAAEACRTLIAGHRPQWLISAGFCGGLVPQLRRNDIVAATSFFVPTPQPEVLLPELARALSAGVPAPAHQGRLVTVDHIVAQSNEKRALGEATGALACEMESDAVVAACRERGVACLVLRVVSDPVDEELPADLEPLLQKQSTARLFGSVVGTLWRRPASAKDMFRLKEAALIAGDTLAKYLSEVVAKLPLEPRIREAPPKPQPELGREERPSP